MFALWRDPNFRAIAGAAWRPGGTALTEEALSWLRSAGLIVPNGLALDMGCGSGASLVLLASYGFSALGFDRSYKPDALPTLPKRAQRVCADVRALPLRENCADLILCECVLSLLPDPLESLTTFARRLRTRGVCVVSDLTCEQKGGSSGGCLSGARPRFEWQTIISRAGFRLLYAQDATYALRDLAARLVWYGGTSPDHCATSCTLRHFLSRKFGYMLWIAQREDG